MRRWIALGLLVFSLAGARSAEAVVLHFDYSTDTSGFFDPANPNGAAARAALEAAGTFFGDLLGDSLLAIQPGGVNTWQAIYIHPATGSQVNAANMAIPADTIWVFVGARDLGSNTLGRAGPGGYTVSGSAQWRQTVAKRGQTGLLDFGPWGGSLALSTTANWHYDLGTLPKTGTVDLYSVLLHELAHVLGFGTSDSWNTQVSGTTFTGLESVAVYGGAVPLDGVYAHWKDGTQSKVYPLGMTQETAMDPTIQVGTRKVFTDLDVAALDDIGWDIIALPSALAWSGAESTWGSRNWIQYYQWVTPVGGQQMAVSAGRVDVTANYTGSNAAASLWIGGIGTTLNVQASRTLEVAGAVDLTGGAMLSVAGMLQAGAVNVGPAGTLSVGGTLNTGNVNVGSAGMISVGGTMSATGVNVAPAGMLSVAGLLQAGAVGVGPAGMLSVGGTMSATGVNVASAGILQVDGWLTAGQVHIAGADPLAGLPAATLEGTGKVTATTVFIGGVLAPGGSSSVVSWGSDDGTMSMAPAMLAASYLDAESTAAGVPEPSSLLMLAAALAAAAAAAVLRRRR